MPYQFTRMIIFDFSTKLTKSGDPKDLPFFLRFIIGCGAGAVGNFISTPTDIVKIRMVNDHKGERYSGVIDAFKKIYRDQGGIKGLYKGWGPNVTRAAIVSGVELLTYDVFKGLLVARVGMDQKQRKTHFIASSMAGFMAAVASNPADVTKTRYMNQSSMFEGSHVSAISTVKSIWRNEGIRAFYRGFWPNFARLTPWNIVFFMSLEQYRALVLKR